MTSQLGIVAAATPVPGFTNPTALPGGFPFAVSQSPPVSVYITITATKLYPVSLIL